MTTVEANPRGMMDELTSSILESGRRRIGGGVG